MSARIPRPPAAVVLAGASVRLGGSIVLDEVDLLVEAGNFVAILGPNGAGKTTLVRAVLGLLPLSSGFVQVFGRTPTDARHEIGYLPQRRSFDESLRIRGIDIVRLGLDGDRWGVPLATPRRRAERATARARVDRLVELVGASSYARRPIGELSGGEQQRLLIAQALVLRPKLLILDEPLDSLDLPNQAAVASLIAHIRDEEHVTVLMVAHDVNPILPYLDRVVYLASGRAVSGPPEEVVTSETLTQLFDTPVEVLRTSDGRLVVVGQPEPPSYHADRHLHR